MVILNSRKLVYISVPKTGSTSVFNDLIKIAEPKDRYWGHEEFATDYPSLEKFTHRHITFNQASHVISPLMDQGYDVVAACRNPFTRFVSALKYVNRELAWDLKDIEKMSKKIIRSIKAGRIDDSLPFKSQLHFTADQAGLLKVNCHPLEGGGIYNFLNGIVQQASHQNASKHGYVKDFYDTCPELKQLVLDLYYDDFHTLGYSTDLSQIF